MIIQRTFYVNVSNVSKRDMEKYMETVQRNLTTNDDAEKRHMNSLGQELVITNFFIPVLHQDSRMETMIIQ